MKTCPHCTTGFHDSHTTCPTHGGYLNEIIDLKPGMVIRNTYRIVRKLGEGGFGTVYLAEQILMNEPRALKFLSSKLCQDNGFTARFRREVQTLRQVRHKNVVDSGDLEKAEDDSLFFAMEFVDGPDLWEFLDKRPRPFDVQLALDITRGIAEGLGAAHIKGMVHRDIKPENIMMAWVEDRWIPKIADFGVVATKETGTRRGPTSASFLTHDYAAPEQWNGMRAADLDGRTDLYALGGVLYKMLTGKTALDGENYESWSEQHRNVAPRPPSSLRPDLANWSGLDELVLWLLEKNRDQRPKDTVELLAALDSIQFVSSILPTSEPAPVPQPPKPGPVPPPPPKPTPYPVKKDSHWVAMCAAAFAVVIIIVIVAIVNSSKPTPHSTEISGAADTSLQSTDADHLSSACNGGDATSCNTLADMYGTGNGVTQDATRWNELKGKACEAGRASACLDSADGYEKVGEKAKAVHFYEKACDGNYAFGCSKAGDLYWHGVGVPQDRTKGTELIQKGCNAGNQFGCDCLKRHAGEEAPVVVEQTKSDSIENFGNSCNAGDVSACVNLGLRYENGTGVNRDYSRAFSFYKKGCDGGNAMGCSYLGDLYWVGNGVSQNSTQGRALLQKGCNMGNQWGCKRLKGLALDALNQEEDKSSTEQKQREDAARRALEQ